MTSLPDPPVAVPSPASGPTPGQPPGAATAPVGCSVRLVGRPAYLKSADPMPMLRPPDLVDAAEVGVVVALRPLQQRAVRFRRGTFLLAASDLEPVSPED